LFHKKEKNMSNTAGESRTNTKLNKELKTQATEIGKLRGRINQLVDNIAVLESDLGLFKKNVSRDLLEVIEALKEK
jgi:cell division protein FtsB